MHGNSRIQRAAHPAFRQGAALGYGQFAIRVVMALVLVLLTALTLVSAELYLTNGRSLSATDTPDAPVSAQRNREQLPLVY